MCTGRSHLTFFKRSAAAAVMLAALLAPRTVLAQQSEEWEVTVAPFYLWATKIDGELTARGTTVPVFVSFADAAENLSAAFSVHVEARKGRWGGFADVNFVGLSSESDFTFPGTSLPVIEGEFDLDNTTFEAGASYLVSEPARLAVIGGLRTYTLSTELQFRTPNVQLTPVDASRTAVNGFAGITYRPEISPRLSFLSRGDIGGGSGFTWSAALGLEFRPRPWIGLVGGYKAFGVNVGSEQDEPVREFDVTYYGPVFGLNFHFGPR